MGAGHKLLANNNKRKLTSVCRLSTTNPTINSIKNACAQSLPMAEKRVTRKGYNRVRLTIPTSNTGHNWEGTSGKHVM